ncbi:pyrimidine/purine nucleoside phosphorylase [Oceanimonas marisflavi]|uniref:pyrimidine/purine nucleoside phosphorylase n=1 Tax=Oceanimonas marisflavi TaxID=2059724 RepID=UPI000D312EBA|nr:pyrimidine/purine nucleoside phosphorylase [Oceanimonas marisflavi]
MSQADAQFDNVSVETRANVYHDGKVTSRVVKFADGSHKTLGIMLPGEYTFGTEAAELMEITAGDLEVQLPGSSDWQRIQGGESFEVPANASFNLKVHSLVDYCCSYIK